MESCHDSWTLDPSEFGCDFDGEPPEGTVVLSHAVGPRDYSLDDTCLTGAALDQHVAESRAWFASVGCPRLWVAPLVGYSDPSFRQLARECGADIAHTQMLDAGGWSRSSTYRAIHDVATDSGPLIVQLGGSRAEQLGQAAEELAALPTVAGVELNLGCPQRCARKLRFGAFLAEDVSNLRRCVAAMRRGVDAGSARRPARPAQSSGAEGSGAGGALNPTRCALLCKIRCFGQLEETLAYARLLQALGAHCVTVHGRTRHHGGGRHTGTTLANWEWIRAVKAELGVPVIANGNVRDWRDVEALLAATGCEGAMTGVGALRRPHKTFAPVERTELPGQAPRLRARARFPSRAHAASRYLEIALARGEDPWHVHAHFTGKLALVSYAAAGRAPHARFDGSGPPRGRRDSGAAAAENGPPVAQQGGEGAAVPAPAAAAPASAAAAAAASAEGIQRARQPAHAKNESQAAQQATPAAKPNHLGEAAWAFRKLHTFHSWDSAAAQQALSAIRAALAAQCAVEETHRAAKLAEAGSEDAEESDEDYENDSDDGDGTGLGATAGG